MTDTTIAVFARAPEPGKTKTRLMPVLGAAGAAQLQEALIERALTTAVAAACGRVELWCEPSVDHAWLSACIGRHGIAGATQNDGDLGARMQHAAAASLSSSRRVLIMGTDCPALTASYLRAAHAALDSHDAVLVPAEDGGYVLLGLQWWSPRLFSDIVWGSDQVCDETCARLAALNWRWHCMPALWDVDRPEDFTRLLASGLMPELGTGLTRPLS